MNNVANAQIFQTICAADSSTYSPELLQTRGAAVAKQHTFKYNSTSHTAVHKHKIPRHVDILSKWYLMSDIGFMAISRMYIKSNGHVIAEITGRCLYILALLRGERDKIYLALPFPTIHLCALPFSEMSIESTFLNSVEHIERKNRYVRRCLQMPDCVTNIITDYISNDCYGNIDLYAISTVIAKQDKRDKNIIEDMYQYHELTETMDESEMFITANLPSSEPRVSRIIITFNRRGDRYNLLDILKCGVLSLNDYTHTAFTGDTLHSLDKKIHDAYVPREPIYTITLDNNQPGTASYLNLGKINAKLQIEIVPQRFDVEMNVIVESMCQCMSFDGVMRTGCGRYRSRSVRPPVSTHRP
jgi:hypothetical protein